MNRLFRGVLWLVGAVAMILAIGFFLQASWATALWPLKASRLSNIFISSILAASGVPILWVAWSGETRAAAGGALNLALFNAGAAIYSFLLYLRDGAVALLLFGLVTALAALGCIGIYLHARRAAFLDTRTTPLPVRIAFGLFSVLLLLTGGALVLQKPNVFPWPLSPETSVYYGWIFLGAMVYFLYGLIRPYISNARGQLLGFLAYDLVLIVPFLLHFQTVRPDLRVGLFIYTGVLIFSGAVAVYYLFIHRTMRFRAARRDAQVVVPG